MGNVASKDGRHVQEYLMFVERFTYDVLEYTLTKFGFPIDSLPFTDCAENIYHRISFMDIAGVSVLRFSLVMRDTWKQMFKSRRNSSGFNDENILEFMLDVAMCYRTSRTSCIQTLVELLLALCNEIMLFFHLEKIHIDFGDLLKQISVCIADVTGLNRNDPRKLEELFDSFDDLSGYKEWIITFILRFAIRYKSHVSDRFLKHVSEKLESDLNKLADSFKFLPYDLFSAIGKERSENLAKSTSIQSDGQSPRLPNLTLASMNISEHLSQNQRSKLERRVTAGDSKSLTKVFSISNDSQSLEPYKLPTDSDMGAEGIKKSLGSQSTCTENVSELLAENNQSSDISSEVAIEQDSGKTGLVTEKTSLEIYGAKAKHKIVEKLKDICKRKGFLVLFSLIAFAFLVMCFIKYTNR